MVLFLRRKRKIRINRFGRHIDDGFGHVCDIDSANLQAAMMISIWSLLKIEAMRCDYNVHIASLGKSQVHLM